MSKEGQLVGVAYHLLKVDKTIDHSLISFM